MKCGNCNYTDDLCYTSNPPKVKCTITGKLRYYGEECDAFRAATIVPVEYAIPCLICGETIRTTNTPINYPEVCDKCKAAVLKIRGDDDAD